MTTGESGPGSNGEAIDHIEIERKWLVEHLPADLMEFPHAAIRQGYVVIGEDGSEVRLRDENGIYTLTVKSKGDLTRGEWETEITPEQFNTLWPTTVGKRVEKTRYRLPWNDSVIELDVYEGSLEGLVVAEVEFGDEASAGSFEIPDWLGSEVTADKSFKNQRLATAGKPDL